MCVFVFFLIFFFFQAEDGIRDWSVTGVQTCALPILYIYVAVLFVMTIVFFSAEGQAVSHMQLGFLC